MDIHLIAAITAIVGVLAQLFGAIRLLIHEIHHNPVTKLKAQIADLKLKLDDCEGKLSIDTPQQGV